MSIENAIVFLLYFVLNIETARKIFAKG